MPLVWKWQLPFFERHGKSLERSAIAQGALLIAINERWDQDPHRYILLACIAYWIVILLIMLRRETQMTKTDRALMTWGILPLIIPICALAALMMRFKP